MRHVIRERGNVTHAKHRRGRVGRGIFSSILSAGASYLGRAVSGAASYGGSLLSNLWNSGTVSSVVKNVSSLAGGVSRQAIKGVSAAGAASANAAAQAAAAAGRVGANAARGAAAAAAAGAAKAANSGAAAAGAGFAQSAANAAKAAIGKAASPITGPLKFAYNAVGGKTGIALGIGSTLGNRVANNNIERANQTKIANAAILDAQTNAYGPAGGRVGSGLGHHHRHKRLSSGRPLQRKL